MFSFCDIAQRIKTCTNLIYFVPPRAGELRSRSRNVFFL
nr:MAG TPA: hypothetical protein [Caudoviricetes sp.]